MSMTSDSNLLKILKKLGKLDIGTLVWYDEYNTPESIPKKNTSFLNQKALKNRIIFSKPDVSLGRKVRSLLLL